MWTRREEPFPLEQAIDLRAIVRSLYLVAESKGDRGAMARLRRTGDDLTVAIDLGRHCAIGTGGHQAALRRVERAVAAIADAVDPLMPATDLLAAAQGRAMRGLGRR